MLAATPHHSCSRSMAVLLQCPCSRHLSKCPGPSPSAACRKDCQLPTHEAAPEAHLSTHACCTAQQPATVEHASTMQLDHTLMHENTEAWWQPGHPKESRLAAPPTPQSWNMQGAALQGQPAAVLLVLRQKIICARSTQYVPAPRTWHKEMLSLLRAGVQHQHKTCPRNQLHPDTHDTPGPRGGQASSTRTKGAQKVQVRMDPSNEPGRHKC